MTYGNRLSKGAFSFTAFDIGRIANIEDTKSILLALFDDLQSLNTNLNVEAGGVQNNFENIPTFGWVWSFLLSNENTWSTAGDDVASDGDLTTRIKLTATAPAHLFFLSALCDSVKVYGACEATAQTHFHLKIEAYYDDAWHTIEAGTTAITNNTWTTFALAAAKFVPLIRVTDMTAMADTYLAEIMAHIYTTTGLS